MSHLNEHSFRNEDTAINLLKDLRMTKTDQIIERTGIGNDDHGHMPDMPK